MVEKLYCICVIHWDGINASLHRYIDFLFLKMFFDCFYLVVYACGCLLVTAHMWRSENIRS